MTKALNQVDLCFVVDTTGSMGAFIQAAKQHLLQAIATLQGQDNFDLHMGLVEYRDHPPQDTSFVTRSYPLTADFGKMQKTINGLKADGGGDAPEAVYDGVRDACIGMAWRQYSYRIILLVGDAPPHGYSGLNRGRNRPHAAPTNTPLPTCHCGLTAQAVTATAEAHRILTHAICMTADPTTVGAFTELVAGTGGRCVTTGQAQDVVDTLVGVLHQEFRNLGFDRQVLETLEQLGELDVAAVADVLNYPRIQVAAAIARLGQRGFLDDNPQSLLGII